MKVATMRAVDGTLGVAACAVLTVVRRCRDLAPRRRAAPGRILIVKLAEQGATVVAHPALDAAAAMVGPEHLFVLVFVENRPILDELGLLPRGNVLTIRTDHLLVMAADLVRALVRIRRCEIDAVVDFESFSRVTAAISYLSGASTRVGLHSFRGEGPWRGDLMTHRMAGSAATHAEDAFSALVAAVGAPPGDLPAPEPPATPRPAPPLIQPDADELHRVRSVVQDALGAEELPRLVILNANAGDLMPLRRWPTDRYVELARRILVEHPDVAVLLTGSPAERPAIEQLAAAVGSSRCRSVAGRTTLRELLVLYSMCELMVTNDSGPAHYAALTPIRVITLFGPETPVVFGSRSERNRSVYAAAPCSPCVDVFNGRRSECTDNVCMQLITVDEVMGLARSALEDAGVPTDLS